MRGVVSLSFLLMALLLNVSIWFIRASADLHAEPVAFMTGILAGMVVSLILIIMPRLGE